MDWKYFGNGLEVFNSSKVLTPLFLQNAEIRFKKKKIDAHDVISVWRFLREKLYGRQEKEEEEERRRETTK